MKKVLSAVVSIILILSLFPSNLSAESSTSTSRLGHLLDENVTIYQEIGNNKTAITAKGLLDSVYYIKKQTIKNGQTYYLISTQPSAENGVIGWVNSKDIFSHPHVGVDTTPKTFYIKGVASAWSKAWGGDADVVYSDLSLYKNHVFYVDKTEKVGNNIWYRGILDGKRVFVHSSYVVSAEFSSTSRLGHLKDEDVQIYKTLGEKSTSFKATGITDIVYYIKKQAVINGETFYLISKQPSAENGIIGWVNSKDMSTHPHVGVDTLSKVFYIKGVASAWSKAWGGEGDLVYKDLSLYKNYKLYVDKTEKVGNNIWYRGYLNGERIFVHSSYVTEQLNTVSTSRLGHLNSEKVKIYTELGDENTSKTAVGLTGKVYYIKSQAEYNGQLYYLISNHASATSGVVGWVNSNDVNSKPHVGVNTDSKTLYINGSGVAWSKAWGGDKDIVYSDLSAYKDEPFYLDKTEKVGDEIWYRGKLDGNQVFVKPSSTIEIVESSTSRLGKITDESILIYNTIGNKETAFQAKGHSGYVYYIKKQALANNQLYYLISKQPSAENGVIGWVLSTDITSQSHTGVDSNSKALVIIGTGKAYSKAWGGDKDVVYSNLKNYQNDIFYVNKTEKVGNDIWYRGVLDHKQVFIHSNDLLLNGTLYNLTLQQALAMQMKANPQTDKYANDPAYISSDFVDLYDGGSITEDGVRLRTSPKLGTNDNVYKTVNKGTGFLILDDNVKGDSYSGSTRWYKIKYENKELYVHSTLASKNSKVGIVKGNNVRVRDKADSNGHIFGEVNNGEMLTIIEVGSKWHKIEFTRWRNAKQEDVLYYLDPTRFINDEKQRFQFLDLSKPSGISVSSLNKYLENKGILKGLGQAFLDAANKHSVNDLYLVSHAILETGNGTSQLATGYKYNGKTVYNMFGIGAKDSCPLECGAKFAYEKGWFTPYDAVVGGAEFIGSSYINIGQNTIYEMRWNPAGMEKYGYATHQYATDIGWAYKQITTLYNLYNEVGHENLILDIPIYKK